MKHLLTLLLAALTLMASVLLNDSVPEQESAQAEYDTAKVYEMRTYTTHEGKLDDLHRRFENHTLDLFEKHGMTNIAYWVPEEKEHTLIYILSHNSREAAEASWDAFLTDTDWQRVYEESRADGPVVSHVESVFMTTTPYSPMK